MAWRLENSVIRGELFNLRPNSVHGWLELRGAPSLVHLGLTGNMEGELAGKRVQFETELANEEDGEGAEPDDHDEDGNQTHRSGDGEGSTPTERPRRR